MQLDEHFRDVLVPFIEVSGAGVREDADGIAVRAVGRGGPAFNTAVVVAAPQNAAAAVRWARELLEATRRPYLFQVPVDLRPALGQELARNQLAVIATVPAMVLQPPPGTPPSPVELRIEPVTAADELSAHAVALARGFGAPNPAAAIEVFSEALLDDPRVTMFNGHVPGEAEPVATSISVVINGVGGVFGVTVGEQARRRGIGATMTWAAVGAARRAGVDVAALQATTSGLPVYRAMGFREVRTYELFAPRA